MASRDDQLQAYLDALRETGTRVKAAHSVGLSYGVVLDHRRNDPEFAAAEDEAIEEAGDLLEAEAIRRGRDGVERIRHRKVGDEVIEYVETEYSDRLLAMLLQGAKPDKYANRTKSEISGPNGKEIEINDTTAAARVAALLEAAKQRKTADPLS